MHGFFFCTSYTYNFYFFISCVSTFFFYMLCAIVVYVPKVCYVHKLCTEAVYISYHTFAKHCENKTKIQKWNISNNEKLRK